MPLMSRIRRSRHGDAKRATRRIRLKRFASLVNITLTPTVSSLAVVAAVTNGLTITAHALKYAAGPFIVTSTGTLPTGVTAGRHYWIVPVDANTVALTTKRPQSSPPGPVIPIVAATGSGTIAIARATGFTAMFNYLQRVGPKRLRAATDIDNLT